MCVLCQRAAAERLALQGDLSTGSTALALGDAVLASNVLIDSGNVDVSKRLVATDGVMDLYLHASGGAVQVAGGGFGGQTIQSVAIPQQDQEYIRSIVNRLDAIIDLDFRFVDDPVQADVAFYYDTEIEIGSGGGQTLGLATNSSRGWELFINQPEVAFDQDYRQYVNLHEWGHSLGLEHPFEQGDGDVYAGITNPWASAYPEETVMAYRQPLTGSWPDFFSTNDINALIAHWGAEQRFVPPYLEGRGPDLSGVALQMFGVDDDVIGGSERTDWINGSRGIDRISGAGGDDLLRGGKDQDDLNGNIGNDWVYGDLGDDVVRGGQGDDVINGNAGRDRVYGDLGDDEVRGGKDDDWIDGGAGNDQIWGDLGADRVRLSQGDDTVWDFSYADGDRLELAGGISYSLSQFGDDLQINTALGTTTLAGINLNQFNPGAIVMV